MSPKISISLLAAQSDHRLAALARDGHERAFEALVQRYRRPLLRYCRRMRLADARAEDVLQQAFLQAWLAFARDTDVREVRPWLYRIVHNAAVNAMRGPAEGHSELTEAMQAEDSLARESDLQRRMAVHEALSDVAALPQMQQQAIFLTAIDGQSNDEVASVLGISEGALRGLLYRARTTLRSAAAALTPPQLLEWAAGGVGAAGPTAERVAELSATGGMAGLLLKGAVVAVTAGAVATGAVAVNSHEQSVASAAHRASAAGSAGSTADAERQSSRGVIPSSLAPVAQVVVRGHSEHALRQGRGRDGEHRRHGSSVGGPGRGADRSAPQGDRSMGAGSDSGDGARSGQTRGGTRSGREASGDNGGGSSGRSDPSNGGGRFDGSGSAGTQSGDKEGSEGDRGSSSGSGSGSEDANATPATTAPAPSTTPTEALAAATPSQPSSGSSSGSGGAGAGAKGGGGDTATAVAIQR